MRVATKSPQVVIAAARAAAIAAPVFRRHRWTWGNDKNPPSASEIRTFLLSLIENAEENDSEWLESGRFVIVKGEYSWRIFLDLGEAGAP